MDVVICNPLRTPVGRMGGSLSTLTAAELTTALETMCIGGGQGIAAVFEVVR